MKDNVIAVDGLSYVGKSTIARCLAKLTGYTHLNTGHMYRAVAKLVLDRRLDLNKLFRLLPLVEELNIEFIHDEKGSRTMVDGQDWTSAIDEQTTIQFAPRVAVIPEIRDILTRKQREYAKTQTIIMEGRDIGTLVFPHARWKFFVSASFEVRARRMFKSLKPEERSKIKLNDPLFLDRLRRLDDSDLNRPVAPLRKAADAIEYDNSLGPTEVEDALVLYYCLARPNEIINNFISYSDAVLKKAKLCVQEGEMIHGKHR